MYNDREGNSRFRWVSRMGLVRLGRRPCREERVCDWPCAVGGYTMRVGFQWQQTRLAGPLESSLDRIRTRESVSGSRDEEGRETVKVSVGGIDQRRVYPNSTSRERRNSEGRINSTSARSSQAKNEDAMETMQTPNEATRRKRWQTTAARKLSIRGFFERWQLDACGKVPACPCPSPTPPITARLAPDPELQMQMPRPRTLFPRGGIDSI
jgi:hypothetical protein